MAEISCSGTCTLVIQIEPAPATNEKLEDMAFVWAGFLVASVIVLTLRKMLNIFDSTPHES